MDAKSDEAILMGYALNSKAYTVFNKTSLVVEKSIHVVFDETDAAPRKVVLDDDANFEDSITLKLKKQKKMSLKTPKMIPPWKIFKERKLNMTIFQKLGKM